MGITVSN